MLYKIAVVKIYFNFEFVNNLKILAVTNYWLTIFYIHYFLLKFCWNLIKMLKRNYQRQILMMFQTFFGIIQ